MLFYMYIHVFHFLPCLSVRNMSKNDGNNNQDNWENPWGKPYLLTGHWQKSVKAQNEVVNTQSLYIISTIPSFGYVTNRLWNYFKLLHI